MVSLRMVGAEMPMTSDQVIWSEQNRLHVSYTNVSGPAAGAAGAAAFTLNIPTGVQGSGNNIPVQNAIFPNDTGSCYESCYRCYCKSYRWS